MLQTYLSWHKSLAPIVLATYIKYVCVSSKTQSSLGVLYLITASGVATPKNTRACAHIKFTSVRVKIMWKAKVKDQVLACVIANFMWTCSEHTGKTDNY